MFGMTTRRLVVAGAVVAVAGTIGGYAYAVSSATGTTLAACAKSDGGQLRLDSGDGCRPSETAVRLGTAAATRADERYYVAPRIIGGTGAFPLPVGSFPAVLATATPIITTHVPAGNYAITAQVTAANLTGTGYVVCLWKDSDNVTHGFAATQLGNGAGFASVQTITMDGALVVPEDTDLRLFCWSTNFGGSAGSPEVWAADVTTKSVDVATITQETH